MPGIWQFGIYDGAISCPGGGEVCETGMQGACGIGVTVCRRPHSEAPGTTEQEAGRP